MVNSVFFLQDVVIQTEDEIRVKIVGTRVDATDIVSILCKSVWNSLLSYNYIPPHHNCISTLLCEI